MITRHLETVLTQKIFQSKAIIIMGPRQVGKTTLLRKLFLKTDNTLWLNGEELGNLCGLDSKTVEKYIQLLEKTFVVFKLSSFSRNLRNELKNSKKNLLL